MTLSIATLGGALWLMLEALLGYAVRPADLGSLLIAHVVAATVTSVALALLGCRRPAPRYVDRSNPFWAGVGYGFLAVLASSVVAGVLDARAGVPNIVGAVWFSVLTVEFLATCLIGALTWGWLAIRRPVRG